jgi:hypothetical protein
MYPLTAFAFAVSNVQLNQSKDDMSSPVSDQSNSCGTGGGGVGSGPGGLAGVDGVHLGLTRNSSFASDCSPSREKAPAFDVESRRIVNMVCTMKTNLAEDGKSSSVSDKQQRVFFLPSPHRL